MRAARRLVTPALALALALTLAAPAALAHIDHPPPRFQPFQFPREASLTMNGTRATADLFLQSDPLKHLVRHVVDPAEGLVSSEYRAAASDTAGAFRLTTQLERVVEYRDVNENLEFDPQVDILIRSWTFEGASWRAGEVQRLAVGRAPVQTVNWTATLGAGPTVNILLSVAAAAVTDEGATGFPQDVFLYVDLVGFPPRGTGHLFALEGRARAHPASVGVAQDVAAVNVTTAIFVKDERRLAFLQWGGEAVVDGRERALEATLGAPDGEGWQPFGLHFPIMDRGARLVVIAGAEYAIENKRAPAPGVAWLVAPALIVALALRRLR